MAAADGDVFSIWARDPRSWKGFSQPREAVGTALLQLPEDTALKG